MKSPSRVQLFATSWTIIALQAPASMEYSRQEYWSGLPFHLDYGINSNLHAYNHTSMREYKARFLAIVTTQESLDWPVDLGLVPSLWLGG